MALFVGLLSAPTVTAEPPFRVQDQVTDSAGVLSGSQKAEVNAAVDKLFKDRQIKLWVVYVKTFDDMGWLAWSQQTEKLSDLGSDDALLAIATEDRSFAFNVDTTVTGGTSTLSDDVRRRCDRTRTAQQRLGRCRDRGRQRTERRTAVRRPAHLGAAHC